MREVLAFSVSRTFLAHSRQCNGPLRISLQTNCQVLAKNQPENSPAMAGTRVIIPELIGTHGEANPLCPVRAIQEYVKRTKPCRKGRKLLFISMKPSFNKEISPITLSGWLKQAITSAYYVPSTTVVQDTSSFNPKLVKAHQIRSAASTWKLQRGCSMRQLMDACYWRSHTSFTSFYLKDHWTNQSGPTKFNLGPFIAAGSTVNQI